MTPVATNTESLVGWALLPVLFLIYRVDGQECPSYETR